MGVPGVHYLGRMKLCGQAVGSVRLPVLLAAVNLDQRTLDTIIAGVAVQLSTRQTEGAWFNSQDSPQRNK